MHDSVFISPHRRLTLIMVFAIAMILAASSFAADTAGAGRTIFDKSKCNSCHGIKALSIPSGKVKAPDLTGVGQRHDVAWLKRYLKKEEKMNGKLHMKSFSGTDAELATLTQWLASL